MANINMPCNDREHNFIAAEIDKSSLDRISVISVCSKCGLAVHVSIVPMPKEKNDQYAV